MKRFKAPLSVAASIVVGLSCLTACSGYEQVAYHDGNPSDVVATVYKHKYGVEVSKTDWEGRGRDGQVICTLKNGVTVNRSYVNGALEGAVTYTFPHSHTIERVDTYRSGRKIKQVDNYTSGLPKEEQEFLAGGSTVVTGWYESGTPKSVEERRAGRILEGKYYTTAGECDSEVVDADGVRHLRDAYGELLSADTIEDGWMILRTTMHSNGTPKEMIPFERGVISGLKRTFLPGGEPNTVEQWQDGEQHGITTVYRNGERFSEVPFESGVRKGIEKRFRDGYSVEEEVTWYNDMRHGPTRAFIGESVKTDWYFQNKLVSKIAFDQMAGA